MATHLSEEDIDLVIAMLKQLKDASANEKLDERAYWQSQYPYVSHVQSHF